MIHKQVIFNVTLDNLSNHAGIVNSKMDLAKCRIANRLVCCKLVLRAPVVRLVVRVTEEPHVKDTVLLRRRDFENLVRLNRAH